MISSLLSIVLFCGAIYQSPGSSAKKRSSCVKSIQVCLDAYKAKDKQRVVKCQQAHVDRMTR